MEILYFTEQPDASFEDNLAVSEQIGPESYKITALTVSNQFYKAAEGSRLYRERLEEYRLADSVGFDGIMLNEHHAASFCMSPRINIVAAMLAAVTKNVKIVLLGNPLPIADNPVHLAEELAMIDMVSGGRLVSGFVRGGGIENIQANANPVHNRERFNEAHDLVMAAWTKPGPFRWEGKHYNFRIVNPWARPLQQPHPPIWIPGVVSRETVVWAAQHGYPYIGLNTNFDLSAKIKDLYSTSAAEAGITAGPEHFGQLLQCHVADSEEKAERNAQQFMWMRGEFTGQAHPVWASPTGYGSPSNRKSLVEISNGRRPMTRASTISERKLDRTFVWGKPDRVIEQLKIVIEKNRPGVLSLWGNDGRINHEDSMSCIRLMGEEVVPAIREFAKSIGIKSPMETGAGYNVVRDQEMPEFHPIALPLSG